MTESTEVVVATPVGIKETKEAFIGASELTIFIIKRLKDGVDVEDALALFSKLTSDDEFKKLLADAYTNANLIPAEMKDIDLNEGLELGGLALAYVPKYVAAFKK